MNHLGSPVAFTDDTGTVVWPEQVTPFKIHHYEPFGADFDDIGTPALSPQDVRYTGKLFDADTGKHYFNARYLNAVTDTTAPELPPRFLTPDIVIGTPGSPQSWNRYASCLNNPVNYIDPDGQWGVQFGSFNVGIDDPWLLFDNSSWMEISKGAAATLDGIIPFADPFEIAYADESGNIDSVYKTSRHLGAFARDIYIGARIPNITKWLKNPKLYEIGSKTVPSRVWTQIQHMDVVDRGRWLLQHGDELGRFGVGEMLQAYKATWNTGFTPGGRLLLELVPFSVTDTIMRSSN